MPEYLCPIQRVVQVIPIQVEVPKNMLMQPGQTAMQLQQITTAAHELRHVSDAKAEVRLFCIWCGEVATAVDWKRVLKAPPVQPGQNGPRALN